MKLTNYIINLGRAIAFYPGLKRITNSTTATILLCQLLYWSDKTDDGWIRKNSYDLEDETGLTYYEQKTAREVLVNLGVLEEKYKRLDHVIAFKIDQDKLNNLWEEETRKPSVPRPAIEEEPEHLNDYKDPNLIIEPKESPTKNVTTKQGDLVDGYIKYSQSPGLKKEAIINEITDKLERKFHINALPAKRWKVFFEYAYNRQERHNESIDTFLDWAVIQRGFDPSFWPPEKCITMWPGAFVEKEKIKPREDFVMKLPEQKEKEVVPMPDELKTKRKLY